MNRALAVMAFSVGLAVSAEVQAEQQLTVRSGFASGPPVVDGQTDEWPSAWVRLPLAPALSDQERLQLELPLSGPAPDIPWIEVQWAVADGRLYLAARWSDATESRGRPEWRRAGKRYRRVNHQDDKLAVRFHLSGDFQKTMIAERTYSVDVWVWSAGFSAETGYALDYSHLISLEPLDDVAEYENARGQTVYIDKRKDAGTWPLSLLPRPRKAKAARLPVYEVITPTGSAADVQAADHYGNGVWQVEMVRALDTGNPDDRNFRAGSRVLTQFAVFDQNGGDAKSVSEPFWLEIKP